MALFCCENCRRHTCRAAADYGYILRGAGRSAQAVNIPAQPHLRVDRADGQPGVARGSDGAVAFVAADAGTYILSPPGQQFFPIGEICYKSAGQAKQVAFSFCKTTLHQCGVLETAEGLREDAAPGFLNCLCVGNGAVFTPAVRVAGGVGQRHILFPELENIHCPFDQVGKGDGVFKGIAQAGVARIAHRLFSGQRSLGNKIGAEDFFGAEVSHAVEPGSVLQASAEHVVSGGLGLAENAVEPHGDAVITQGFIKFELFNELLDDLGDKFNGEGTECPAHQAGSTNWRTIQGIAVGHVQQRV